jgi:hypothetical protein
MIFLRERLGYTLRGKRLLTGADGVMKWTKDLILSNPDSRFWMVLENNRERKVK